MCIYKHATTYMHVCIYRDNPPGSGGREKYSHLNSACSSLACFKSDPQCYCNMVLYLISCVCNSSQLPVLLVCVCLGFSEGLSFVGKCEDFNIAVNTALKSLILFSLGQQLNHPRSGSGAGFSVQHKHLCTPTLPLSGHTVQLSPGKVLLLLCTTLKDLRVLSGSPGCD